MGDLKKKKKEKNCATSESGRLYFELIPLQSPSVAFCAEASQTRVSKETCSVMS